MSANDILPNAQNGFREGYRTNNCSYILRAAIERCRARGDTLYVAFIDLKNAFPSTNLPTLWRKLFEWGARGPIMDWFRMLYGRMQYVVTSGGPMGECTRRFMSLWGILAGDSASPDFFNAFASDYRPSAPASSAVVLDGEPIYNVMEADDMMGAATGLGTAEIGLLCSPVELIVERGVV